MARSALSVVRIHTDSAAAAWLSRVSITEAPTVNENPYIAPVGDPNDHHKPASSGELGCGARGCVREGVIAGNWALHGMDASWVDIAGKTEVAYLTDNGMLSDMFQSFPTIPGNEYRVEYEVYVPTMGDVFDCRVPKTGCWGSGSLDIHDGEHCDMADYDTWDAQAAQGNYGTTQAGSAYTCFTEQSDILYLNPLVAGEWLTLSGTFIAPSSQAVVRIHTDSAAVAYVARVSVQEVPDVIMNPRLWRNGHTHNKRASSGENGCVSNCVVAGVVAGDWSLHGMNIDWVDMAGKQEVAYLTDAGMLSDLFQPFQTIPGNEYRVEYEVYVPTDADVFDCRVPKTGCWGSGSLDIHDGEDCAIEDYDTWDAQAAQGNYGTTQAGSANTCFTEQSDILYLNPLVAGEWLTLSGTFIAPSRLAVVRIHTDSAAVAYVARVSIKQQMNQVMNPLLLPNGEGTANHAGASAAGHEVAAGVLAGDWMLHNTALSYAAIAGRNDVLLMEDNGALSDLWQSFPTQPGCAQHPCALFLSASLHLSRAYLGESPCFIATLKPNGMSRHVGGSTTFVSRFTSLLRTSCRVRWRRQQRIPI
jgi:hypothetical protein